MEERCPVCREPVTGMQLRSSGMNFRYHCPRCGPYSLTSSAQSILGGAVGESEEARAKISYALYRMTKREPWALLNSSHIEHILGTTVLPRPQEQLENLVLWLGERQANTGAKMELTVDIFPALGVGDPNSAAFVIEHAISKGLLEGRVQTLGRGAPPMISPIRLSFDGWALYEELQRGHSSSRIAFMAMQFNDSELDGIYADHFKPSVAATGFTLRRVDENPQAGLIDDRLRVEIRQARFVIADLTHGNKGAYWEAGYAEGLGKPVIYTCRKDVFDDKAKGPHFDTNHHLTVVWEADKLEDASKRLKATIRATLPEDAKLSD